MDFNYTNKQIKNTNSKEFLESQLKELDNDFNILYDRMNKKRKELTDLEQKINKESKK